MRKPHIIDGYGRNNNNNIDKVLEYITDSSTRCSVLKKGAWTKQEDDKLISYIRKHGEGHWRTLPQAAGLVRCGKSCRLRWVNYLKPDLKRGSFGEDEEDLIIKLHALLGNRWSLIAGRLPGRTDNEVKNYWNSHLKRKLISNGIDPNNHRLHQTLSRSSIISPFPTIKSTNTHTHIINDQTTTNSHDQSKKLDHHHQLASNSDSWSCVIQDNSTISNNNLINNSSNSLPDLNLELESSLIIDVQEESGDARRQLHQQHCACNDIIWSLNKKKQQLQLSKSKEIDYNHAHTSSSGGDGDGDGGGAITSPTLLLFT